MCRHQTVSRVLNNSPSIKDSTRARVLEVIEEYDYRPNQAARALTTRRSGAIGVLSAPLTLFGPVTSAHAIEVAARAAGYRITTTHVDLADDASVRQGVSWLLSQSIEGLVVIAPHRRVTSILEDIPIGVPRVTLHSPGVDPAHGLSVDQIEGGRLATRHLIDLGHRRILHLAGPDDWLEASARTRGYVAEMEAAGLEPAPPVVGDWTAETGYRIARDLDLGGAGWTAVFTANDQMALGVASGVPSAAWRSPTTSASSASTTSPRRRTSGRPSPPCGRTSPRWAGERSRTSSPRSSRAAARSPSRPRSPPSRRPLSSGPPRRRRPDVGGASSVEPRSRVSGLN